MQLGRGDAEEGTRLLIECLLNARPSAGHLTTLSSRKTPPCEINVYRPLSLMRKRRLGDERLAEDHTQRQ